MNNMHARLVCVLFRHWHFCSVMSLYICNSKRHTVKSIHSRCNAGDGSDMQAVWEILAKVCITAANVGTQAINSRAWWTLHVQVYTHSIPSLNCFPEWETKWY